MFMFVINWIAGDRGRKRKCSVKLSLSAMFMFCVWNEEGRERGKRVVCIRSGRENNKELLLTK